MPVLGTTRLVGVIGSPIEHSLSPVMQNAAYEALGLDLVYVALHVKQADLGKAMLGLTGLNAVGVNVTQPHKASVMEFLDTIDAKAKQIGAVNVVLIKSGKLQGFNTDGDGFLQSLRKDAKFEPQHKRGGLLGAGGAAAAVAMALAGAGVRRLVIANRTKARAEILAKRVQRYHEREVIPIALDDSRGLFWHIREADLLINATSVGLKPGQGIKVNPNAIHRKLVVYDLTCWDTPFLKMAAKRALHAVNGLGMLVSQGAKSFEIFTGKRAPFKVMRTAVEQAIKARAKVK